MPHGLATIHVFNWGTVKIQTILSLFSEKKEPVGSRVAGNKEACTVKGSTVTRGGLQDCQGFLTREVLLLLLVVMG